MGLTESSSRTCADQKPLVFRFKSSQAYHALAFSAVQVGGMSEMVILFGLARRTARTSRKHHYFTQSILHFQTEVERRGRDEEVVNQEVGPGVRAP